MPTIGVAIIGSGGIALANHLPGFALCPDTRVVALCDTNAEVLEAAGQRTGIATLSTDYREILKRDDVHAVVVATPNVTHSPIVKAAAAAGKHVLCEKPIAMSLAESLEMIAAVDAAGVRHMTAFTYRFVPAMRYMAHLVRRGDVGTPFHFRAQRFQDWGDRNLGWRMKKGLAGTGELGDMLSHRIDYGHFLIGPIARLVADVRKFVDVRGGDTSELEDWVGVLAQFRAGATGVLESTKLATGRGENRQGRDICEINGSDATIEFTTQRPLELKIGNRETKDLETVPVPVEFQVWPGSSRKAGEGDPVVTFRYDQNFEFIAAIREGRPCNPSLIDGARAQAVMNACIQSAEQGRWVDVPEVGA